MRKQEKRFLWKLTIRLERGLASIFGQRGLYLPLIALIATSGGAMGFAMQGQNYPSEAANRATVSISGFERATSTDRRYSSNSNAVTSESAQMVTTTGMVKPGLLVEVGTQLSGTVAEILADFNDPVRKDQPLARLAPETFEAVAREAQAALAVARATARLRATAIDRAAAKVQSAISELSITKARLVRTSVEQARAQREFKRKAPLARKGNLPRSELDRVRTATAVSAAATKETEAELQSRKAALAAAKAEHKMAKVDHQVAQATVAQRQAALDRAEVDLDRTVIRSPLDGIVVARKVDVGQTVAASLNAPTLFTVARDLRKMQVHANVDEADIGQIRSGQPVIFTVDAYPDRKYHGTVSQIRKAPAVIQNVVSYTIVISADNKDKTLMPGMTTLVRIDTGRRPTAWRTLRR